MQPRRGKRFPTEKPSRCTNDQDIRVCGYNKAYLPSRVYAYIKTKKSGKLLTRTFYRGEFGVEQKYHLVDGVGSLERGDVKKE